MPAGRPLKYKTPAEMQKIIDQYFDDCKRNALFLAGNGDESEDTITDDAMPTVTGLALSLNMTRKGLIDYENKDNPEFGNTIKKAKARVEAFIEQRLYLPNATGSIFNLKNNFGWKDKTETEIDATVKTEDVSAKDVVAKFLESKS